jgi:hypothetical protein
LEGGRADSRRGRVLASVHPVVSRVREGTEVARQGRGVFDRSGSESGVFGPVTAVPSFVP